MTRKNYVEIPRDRLLADLAEVERGVAACGGSSSWSMAGWEKVLEIIPPGAAARVRLFTSLAEGASTVRACGADAVRIIVGFPHRPMHGPDREVFRAVGQKIRLYRTAPRDGDRVGAFLARLREALRDAYRRAVAVPKCPSCGAAMVEREGKRGAFLGCTDYPACTTTRELPRRAAG